MSDGAWGFLGLALTAVFVPSVMTVWKFSMRVIRGLERIERGTAFSAEKADVAAEKAAIAVTQTLTTGNGFAQRVTDALADLKEGQARAETQRSNVVEQVAKLTGRFDQHISEVEKQAEGWEAWRRSQENRSS